MATTPELALGTPTADTFVAELPQPQTQSRVIKTASAETTLYMMSASVISRIARSGPQTGTYHTPSLSAESPCLLCLEDPVVSYDAGTPTKAIPRVGPLTPTGLWQYT